MKKLWLLAGILLAGCTAPGWSREALEKSGYTDIETGGYSWFGCGKDDEFSTKFSAVNPAGVRVSGVVCCGLLKSCTVRF